MKVNEDKDSESSNNRDGMCCCNPEQCPYDQTYVWYPKQVSIKELEYVRRMESEFTSLQRAVLTLTTQFARLQFRIRQIVHAEPSKRDAMLLDLENLASNTANGGNDEVPHIQRDSIDMGDVRRKQHFILDHLHQQLATLADERSSKYVPKFGDDAQAARNDRGGTRSFAKVSDTTQYSEPDFNAFTSGADSEYSASIRNKADQWRETEGESDKHHSRSSSRSRKGLVELCL
ncbi:PREDICTED: uncharacterized protein LOC108975945 [Bactrocera latifrons]|uniref:RUN domain-containing protein 1 n=1 Tax=Bactrocera latifrons TaxID=174628 RepID=A0A0K8VXP6_BACLA|nr:PREDICTED: uncharacterized protein LOC108975945 [Bactrocera latifrons]